jgi:serine/threonine-protein kinase
VLHRDLKPSNLMVDGAGRIFVMDWGIARSGSDASPAPTGRTGTVVYMAPEQARGLGRQIDRRTDVYGLGAILYELLCGRPPIQAETERERLSAARAGRIAPLPPTDRDLEAICRKALQPQQASRYATAKELSEDLVRYLEGRPVASRSEGLLAAPGSCCAAIRAAPPSRAR